MIRSHSLPRPLDKPIAQAMHEQIRTNQCTNYELGLFYRSLLKEKIWTRQNKLAADLGISAPTLSQLLALASIAPEIVEALGGPSSITFRTGKMVLDAIDRFGECQIVDRLRDAKKAGYSELNDLLEYAVEDRLPDKNFKPVRVRIAHDKRSLRVEIGDLSRFSGNFARLEEWLRSSLVLFEAALEAQQRIAGHDARVERTRRSRHAPNTRREGS
jgi:hypothetical protein